MADESDPPRKFYRLKPTEFERVNAPPSSPPAELPVPATSARSPAANPSIDVRELARQAAAGAPLLKGNSPANRANDVHALLRQNLAHANAAGLNELAPKPQRRSKRKRDYFLSLLVGNAVLLAGAALQPIFGIAGMIIFNLGLTWIMWFVMDDY